ncbi:MAG: hypothetical protein WDN00_11815 [Limisphaerales bacterium]
MRNFIRAEFGTNGWAETTGPQITAPIIYDTALNSWNFLETGGSNTTRIISAPNKFGDMIGWELIDQGSGQSRLVRPRKWTRSGAMLDYSPAGLPPNAVPMVINDAGRSGGRFWNEYHRGREFALCHLHQRDRRDFYLSAQPELRFWRRHPHHHQRTGFRAVQRSQQSRSIVDDLCQRGPPTASPRCGARERSVRSPSC